ncbi:Reverse transcriptase RNA-dependent DNA polymerase [Ceratocystis lukuohia]|uniref:Reverse transcriptase RNA-dependent DNA polymerase n=1 Tax=Ceratocystis lukuohia TaxID=2019550 RepID=A0ABR4MBE2_9PEZI
MITSTAFETAGSMTLVSHRSNQNKIQAINPFGRVCFDFIQMDCAYNARNQYGHNVRCFHSDNDWVLLGAPYRELTQKFVIITESSATSTRPIRFEDLFHMIYGQKLHWYQHLTNTLLDIRLVPVNGCNCLFKDPNGTLLVMYYVDDLIYTATETDELRAFERKIAKIYETNFLGPASWFLGVRILRDRSQWKLWLVQDAYTKQLITKFNIVTTHKYQTPVRPDNMAPRESTQAQPDFVNLYQQKVGSLNWPAVVTRPDIAFAASQLARFMSNADRALAYLASTPTLAIEYSLDAMESVFKVYESDFKIYSDSAFADNIDTRRSSYGSLFMLHHEAID